MPTNFATAILLSSASTFTLSAVIHAINGNDKWFSRLFAGLVVFGLAQIILTLKEKK